MGKIVRSGPGSRRFFLTILVVSFGVYHVAHSADPPIDFEREIRPILSNHCFQCHGADEGTRRAGLRLDVREDALDRLSPDSASDSEFIRRIVSTDSSELMPPVDAHKPLNAREIDLLKRWVSAGAKYEAHWAFEPLKPVALPVVQNHDWAKNRIDLFVLEQQEKLGVSPSEPASKNELIRRLFQDVTGLLPSPDEVQRFTESRDPLAVERLIDKLLESPHFGERWGRHWLDQARYAESDGFTIDGQRTVWPYRDWVIQAINEDLPFDQFTINQLAGDLLENPTKAQLVATGFHRNTMINTEGGVKADQFRHEAITDRVNTTAAVWMGLTLACAQCHTHKFDPLTHRDYYAMYAFFNQSADENNVGPVVPVFEGEMFQKEDDFAAVKQELEEAKRRLVVLQETQKLRFIGEKNEFANAWQAVNILNAGLLSPSELAKDAQNEMTDNPRDGNTIGDHLQTTADGTVLVSSQVDPNADYSIRFSSQFHRLTGIKITVMTHESLPASGPGLAGNGNFVLTEAEFKIDDAVIPFTTAYADHEQEGYPANAVIDQDAKTGWAINVSQSQLSKHPDLKMNAQHELVLLFSQPVEVEPSRTLKLILRHQLNKNYLIGHFRVEVMSTDLQNNDSGDSDRISEDIAAAKRDLQKLESRYPGSSMPVNQMIMRDRPQPALTYRLQRGDFLSPAESEGAIPPAPPEVLMHNFRAPRKFENRLDLALWLVAPENPLTARVTVNRVWMHYFGKGLVETENDFGAQGQHPTHPELLDDLANYLIDHQWSIKQLHREILNSATYQQSSHFREELQEIDPGNHLLTRQNRFRVDAEVVRDQALSASGLINPKIGGPSFFPPQPDGVYRFTQTPKSWPTSEGRERYRRTMYTTFYRSSPHPLLSTFDTPDLSISCTARPRSNTPLQSLALANDVNFIEPAQALAVKIVRQFPDDQFFEERLQLVFQHCLSRNPTNDELHVLQDYQLFLHKSYKDSDSEAIKVCGEFLPEDSAQELNCTDVAVWVHIARTVMNTDEFVTRQ